MIGVVNQNEYTYAIEGLKQILGSHNVYDDQRIRIQLIPCGDKSVYLPYRLLTWLQLEHQSGGLKSIPFNNGGHHKFDYVYYTEADNVVSIRRHDEVATALIDFLDDATFGRQSYIAPQRYEGGRGPHNINARSSVTSNYLSKYTFLHVS